MKKEKAFAIGVTGRSGSGKTSFVRNIQKSYGRDIVTIHTMDNYYLQEQLIDENGYKNFDLPTSFNKPKFCADFDLLKSGKSIEIPKYEFKIEGGSHVIHIQSAPIIIVEGLFIYHYAEIKNQLDFKTIVALGRDDAYQRRLKRDLQERDYTEEVTKYRYFNHVEPAYVEFIEPHLTDMDLIVDNSTNLENGESAIKSIIDEFLS